LRGINGGECDGLVEGCACALLDGQGGDMGRYIRLRRFIAITEISDAQSRDWKGKWIWRGNGSVQYRVKIVVDFDESESEDCTEFSTVIGKVSGWNGVRGRMINSGIAHILPSRPKIVVIKISCKPQSIRGQF